jgi:HPt (histidine-containing phosphotransfer) domain-containing protein
MNAKIFLALSLVVNLALAGALTWSARQKQASPQNDAAAAGVSTPASERTAVGSVATPANALVAEAFKSDQQFNWRTVESEDYKKYIANLRSIGCPEETIRDIITADVNKLFENRAKEMNGVKTNRYEYWKGGMQMFSKMFDEEKIKTRQALAKEKRALLTELLGVAPEEKPDMMAMFGGANPFEEMLDFLTPGQQTQIMELEQKYAARLMKSIEGGADADGMKEMAQVQKEKEAELAKLLSPEEFENYQLRMSQTSMVMRMQMGSFEPSEDEFKAIFKEKKKFEDEFGMAGMNATDKADKEKMKAAEAAMKETLKTTLGDRYTDYELSQDQTYQSIYRVTERNGLGKDSAKKVYDVKKEAESQASALRKDTSLTKEQRDAALKGIRDETENAMKTVLGDKAYGSYEKQAYWLNGISRAPKPADE